MTTPHTPPGSSHRDTHTTALPQLPQSIPAGAAAITSERIYGNTKQSTNTQPLARSLYIHIPFCFHKCHYCDFYSIVDSRDRQGVFTDRLCRELEAIAAAAGPLDTIFVGGGTPTLLRTDLWTQLLATLHDRFDISRATEFTLECNPETARPDLFDVLVAGSVTRLSIGAQSFNPTHLKTLERWHDPASVPAAIDLARQAGIDRVSLDLIYAIPGQTLRDWDEDLTAALALNPSHLSAYNLTFEPNTAMTVRLGKGEFEPTDEDTEIAMFELAASRTAEAGLVRYEVSNYARPGEECKHNLVYWRQGPWLAAGPSASGHYQGHRWKNTPRLDTYLNTTSPAGHGPITDHEPPDATRALTERIMTGLRLTEGLDAAATLEAAGTINAETPTALSLIAANHTNHGHLEPRADRWILTESGMLLADGIAAELMAAIL